MRKKALIMAACVCALLALATGALAYLVLHRVEGHYFDSAGVRIHYTDEGQGEPLLLVHGLGATADLNWRLPGITRMLARHFRVIAMDIRGHGLSGKPEDSSQYGTQMVDDVVRLMDHLKIKRVHIAGYSMGGFIALNLLAHHPDRVCCAAICAAGWKDPEDDSPLGNVKSPPAVPLAAAEASALGFLTRAGHLIVGGMANTTSPPYVRHACWQHLHDLLIPKTLIEQSPVPMMCLCGTNDFLRPCAEALKSAAPGVEFVSVKGATHLNTPMCGDFKRNLLAFFRGHSCEQ